MKNNITVYITIMTIIGITRNKKVLECKTHCEKGVKTIII